MSIEQSKAVYRRFVEDFGLYKLLGTIRYPGGAHAT